MSDKNYVYVAEAYTDDGERTEQLVHTTRTDAVIDIKQTMDGGVATVDTVGNFVSTFDHSSVKAASTTSCTPR